MAQGAPLHAIVVLGTTVSIDCMTAAVVWMLVPAGAPFAWPAAWIQSRKLFRSASSIHPDDAVQVV